MSEKIATEMGEKMEKHTPGEWYATTRRGSWDWLVAIEGTNLEVCQCFHDGTEMNETGEANARLIAAAPDLLEALKQVTATLALITKDSELVDLARAAISKATTQERDRS